MHRVRISPAPDAEKAEIARVHGRLQHIFPPLGAIIDEPVITLQVFPLAYRELPDERLLPFEILFAPG